MEVLLLGIYSFFVWLIFIKFKWLPWNIYSQVTVVVIPIVALTALILTLNVVAPSSSDLRVFRYTVPIVSQVRGRVIDVPIEEGNRPVRKGDVLFRIDPTPYQQQVNTLKAQLAAAVGGEKELQEQLKGAEAKIGEARGGIAQAAARIGADAICMSTHGRTGLAKALLGSQAEAVLRLVQIPVVLVPMPRD